MTKVKPQTYALWDSPTKYTYIITELVDDRLRINLDIMPSRQIMVVGEGL